MYSILEECDLDTMLNTLYDEAEDGEVTYSKENGSHASVHNSKHQDNNWEMSSGTLIIITLLYAYLISISTVNSLAYINTYLEIKPLVFNRETG